MSMSATGGAPRLVGSSSGSDDHSLEHDLLLLLLLLLQVDTAPSGRMVSRQSGSTPQVPDGQALVTDALLPGQALRYTGKCRRIHVLWMLLRSSSVIASQ
jgi:hypothetical protein